MNVVDDFEAYENVSDMLKLTVASGLRAKILMSMREGSKTPGQLREETGSRASSISPNLRELEMQKLIEPSERGYSLTPIGDIIATNLREFVQTLHVIKSHENFWHTHDLSGIPPDLLKEIGQLHLSQVVKADPTDLYKAHQNFIKILGVAKSVCGVSPIFFEDYPQIITHLVDSNVEVKLVVTPTVQKKLQEDHEDYLKTALNSNNFEMRTIDNALVAFTVTDQFLSLGLFNREGSYDLGVDLISGDEESVRWGQKLFNYYWETAVPFK